MHRWPRSAVPLGTSPSGMRALNAPEYCIQLYRENIHGNAGASGGERSDFGTIVGIALFTRGNDGAWWLVHGRCTVEGDLCVNGERADAV